MSKTRRTLLERVQDIFNYIETRQQPFTKSNLKKIGLSPKAAEKWLNLIEYIQAQPRIRVIRTEHNTIIEKIEGKYQAVLRRRITDQNLSYEERIISNEDYLRTLYTRERVGLERFPTGDIPPPKKKNNKK